jgi:hypothetical protein
MYYGVSTHDLTNGQQYINTATEALEAANTNVECRVFRYNEQHQGEEISLRQLAQDSMEEADNA